jgi:hypothetical protein
MKRLIVDFPRFVQVLNLHWYLNELEHYLSKHAVISCVVTNDDEVENHQEHLEVEMISF